MGREVRRVPEDWEHPRDDGGRYVPMFGRSFAKADARWLLGSSKWSEGLRESYGEDGGWLAIDAGDRGHTYAEWAGERPEAFDYMPDWPEAERTHLMMYEGCTEGTPISPAFETPEELARWLADSGASAFAYETASYEAWLRVARGGFAPAAVSKAGGPLVSGVEGLTGET